jgi:hypothetical protein
MTKLTILLFAIGLHSCAPVKSIAPKGSYPPTPMEFKSEKIFDEVWDNLVDVFAQQGLAIKIIDRSSGLIISEKSKLTATIEDKFGKPLDPTAYVVVPKFRNVNSNRDEPISGTLSGVYAKKMIPLPVFGEWNVRVKKSGNGSTINVNITNVSYDVYMNATKTYNSRGLQDYKSTGIFENALANHIK